jgi:DNA-binding CsgD family transcriptional regulator/tetratricopeptide (TPR) repeat protein
VAGLIGRDGELARLVEAAGEPLPTTRVVVVRGAAGIGKTRLMEEFAAEARRPVLRGRSVRLSEPLRCGALISALRGAVDQSVVDALTGLVPLPRAAVLDVLLREVRRLATGRRAVLLVDDLHRSDAATLDALTVLAVEGVAGLCLVLAVRDDEPAAQPGVRTFLAEASRLPAAGTVRLGRLDRHAALQLVHHSRPGLSPTAAEEAVDRGAGVPLFLQEAARLAGDPTAVLSDWVRDLLAGRLESLSPAARDVVTVVAIRGGTMDEDLLTRVLVHVPPGRLRAAIREATAGGVLLDGPSAIDLRQPLLGQLVRERLGHSELTGWHRRLAEGLAGSLRADPAELSEHWQLAGDPVRAVGAALDAAGAAEAARAPTVAHAQLERALAALPSLRAGAPDPVDLRLRAAAAAYRAGRVVRAVELAEAAAAATGPDARWSLIHERLGSYRFMAADRGGARRAYREAEQSLPAHAPPAVAARVLAGLGWSLAWSEDPAAARPVLGRALCLARTAGDDALVASALVGLGRLADGEPAVRRFRAARQLVATEPEADAWFRSSVLAGIALDSLDRTAEAYELASTSADLARRAGQVAEQAALAAQAGLARFRSGSWDEAGQWLRTPAAEALTGVFRLLVTPPRARLLAATGDLGDAKAEIEEALRRCTDAAEGGWGPLDVKAVAADVALHAGDCRSAATLNPADAGDRGSIGLCAVGVRALVAQALLERRRDRTAELSARAARLVQALALWPGASTATLAEARAELTRLDRRPPVEPWWDAVHRWDEVGDVYRAAYCRCRLAGALVAAGGAGRDASAHLRAARACTHQLGARPLLRDIERLARHARLVVPELGKRPPAAHRCGLPLSDRQLEVLALVAEGRTDRQIAAALYISPKTVGGHVSTILARLRVGGRGEAAAVAHRAGLE